MDDERRLELLDEQIAQANNGAPADFALWKQTTDVVLRTVLGETHPLYVRFTTIKYHATAYTMSDAANAHARARQTGVRTAIAILAAAKKDVVLSAEISRTSGTASGGAASGSSVFVVHGHDEGAKQSVARFVAKLTGTEPVILHEQPSAGRTVIEKFEQHAATASFAIVIATPDDEGRAVDDTDLKPRARQNVVFELGFFFGLLGRQRVALLHDERLEQPSDIAGLVRIPLDPAGAWRTELAREVENAGITVDWSALR